MKELMIISEKNDIIKHVKALKLKKYRLKHRQFIVEGLRAINECLHHRVLVHYFLYSDRLKKIKDGDELLSKIVMNKNAYRISENLFLKLSGTENPQGIMAVVEMPEYTLKDLDYKKNLFFVVLDRLQDPGNMGTIIRTAEAAKADAILLTKGCVDPYNSKTVRATMGALFHIPIIQYENNSEWIDLLKTNNVKLIASALGTNQSYFDIEYADNIAIIIGNEANGIDYEILKASDEIVKIPIYGNVESLNASVAAAILIYKAAEYRQLTNR